MTPESSLLKRIQIRASELGWRLFRNSTGMAWTGNAIQTGSNRVILHNARRLRFGLAVGSSDLIGGRPVKITPEMVGTTILQLACVEVKTATGKLTGDQALFLAAIKTLGGFAAMVRSESDLVPR